MNRFFISGDWPFFTHKGLELISWLPTVWHGELGFGVNLIQQLWVNYPFLLIVKLLSAVGLSWFIIDKILWIAILSLVVYSSYQLGKYFFENRLGAFITAVIYVGNTYFLMVFSGGQLGVALAYGFMPLFIRSYLQLIHNIGSWIMLGLHLGVLIMLDLRFAFLGILWLLVISVGQLRTMGARATDILKSLLLAVGINFYWILPIIIAGGNAIDARLIDASSLSFFSVADFSHALSLLHPNWPENLFGRVYFMQPEFILFPVLAFAALLTIKKTDVKNKRIAAIAFVGLAGAFLAKGVHEPFGEIYKFLFSYIPGFFMFRDPTKFYVLVALSYSLLIPFFALSFLATERLKKITNVILVVCILVYGFIMRDVFTAKIQGNLYVHTIPAEQHQFNELLDKDDSFYRVLWLPTVPRFATSTDVHPTIDAETFFSESSVSGILRKIETTSSQELEDAQIRYIAVPIDVEKRIFMDDYKPEPNLRNQLVQGLDKLFVRMDGYADVAVYDLGATGRQLFWSESSGVKSTKITDGYQLEIPADATHVFAAMSYDPGWELSVSGVTLKPEVFGRFMRYQLPQEHQGSGRLLFKSSAFSRYGLIVSIATFVVTAYLLLASRRRGQ